VNKHLLAALGAAGLLLGSALPAAAANTFNVQVNASTVATVTVTTNGSGQVVCNPGTTVTGAVACTNTVNATGAIRSSKAGTATLTASAPAATISGTSGNTIPVAAIQMTCTDASVGGTHGTATSVANAAPSTTAGTVCLSWPGPNVFTYNVNLTFGIDSAQVNADTYSLSSGWTVTASTT